MLRSTYLVDLQSRQVFDGLLRKGGVSIDDLVFSPDSRRLAYTRGSELLILELATVRAYPAYSGPCETY